MPMTDDQQHGPPTPPLNADFPRSASYTYIPDAKEQNYTSRNILSLKSSFSQTDLIADDPLDISPPDSSGWTTPDEHEPRNVEIARDIAAELQKSPKIAEQRVAQPTDTRRSSIASSAGDPSTGTSIDSTRTTSTSTSATKPRPGGLAALGIRQPKRRSWYSTPTTPDSRSPSPPKQPLQQQEQTDEDSQNAPTRPAIAFTRRTSLVKRIDSVKSPKKKKSERELSRAVTADNKSAERPLIRRSTTLRGKVIRPVSNMFKGSSADDTSPGATPPMPAVPSLPKSFSTDRLPDMRSKTASFDRAAPVPRLLSNDRAHNVSALTIARKKDELWSVFRALDGDYAKFVSKSVAFKANVVRTTLLPFLRAYASHASNDVLRPEDLDRRANILNKWWTGLIEMLHGRNNQSISGTDRPVILDGISGIMERPEWRLSPSPFCSLQKRRSVSTPKNRSTSSLSSNASEFLADSVHHNVRNIFVQNLSSQMAFVVDKMSLRNASASLVTFCGKACAYAFMFVPGMADVLSRLWDLQMDPIRRVLEENGVGKFESLAEISQNVLPNFPPSLQQLGFTTLMKFMKKLRTPPPLPLGTNHIQWWGYWLERWTGRESDLFYVFVKHFHILVTDFIPPESTQRERMCVPGLVLVHAQILTNLDATIHRDAKQDPVASGATPTFDDVLAETDALASTIPVLPANATRLMAENRLIMLIRDFLSDRAAEHPAARQLFAESFNDLLQAATKGTSIFDQRACYTLLDFLEEALLILVRFEHLRDGKGPLINAEFWRNVCKKMISSENTLTEMRLYTFLYTIWNTLVCELGSKADFCLELLLDAEVFESRFNHWCPMVRAYYMRLLCWRVARFDEEAHQGDALILETMHERLQTVWSHYLWLREKALESHAVPPPSNPCNPAPSRRFLIVRTDTQVIATGSFLSFDGIMPAAPTPKADPRRFSTLSAMTEIDVRPEAAVSPSEPEPEPARGLRGFFRNMISSRSRSKSAGPSKLPPSTEAISLPPRPESAAALTRSATDDISTATREPRAPATDLALKAAAAARNFSFKFSLEYQPNSKTPGHMRLFPPKLPLPAQQYLQALSSIPVSPNASSSVEPTGSSRVRARYCGRALAEWTIIVGECQSFFDRRKSDGVPANKLVETPVLGIEVFKKPA